MPKPGQRLTPAFNGTTICEGACITRTLLPRFDEVVDGADSALRPWKIFAKQDAGVSSQGVPNDTPS